MRTPARRQKACPHCLGAKSIICSACKTHACWCGTTICESGSDAGIELAAPQIISEPLEPLLRCNPTFETHPGVIAHLGEALYTNSYNGVVRYQAIAKLEAALGCELQIELAKYFSRAGITVL